jgi:hypothetical protein
MFVVFGYREETMRFVRVLSAALVPLMAGASLAQDEVVPEYFQYCQVVEHRQLDAGHNETVTGYMPGYDIYFRVDSVPHDGEVARRLAQEIAQGDGTDAVERCDFVRVIGAESFPRLTEPAGLIKSTGVSTAYPNGARAGCFCASYR